MPRTIALDINGDLDLSGGTINFLEAGASIVQACKIKLQFFQGEWFLALTAGIPYWQQVLVKVPNLTALQVIFKNALLEVEGVSDVVSLTLTLDRAARKLKIAFRVDTDVGLLNGSTSL